MKAKLLALLAILCLLAGCATNHTTTPDPTPATPELTPEQKAEQERQAAQEAALRRLQETLDSMTLEEKVGQLFFVRCPETGAAEDVASYHLGGLLLFGRDYQDASGSWLTQEQLTQTLQSYQDAAAIPLFIGSDEEGGSVTRASRNPNLFAQKFRSPQELFAAGGMEAIARDAREKNSALAALGINVNLAPVCDVSTDENDFIYARSFGSDAEATAEYVKEVVLAAKESGEGCVLKHFPGYGSNADTHTGVAIDQRPYQQFLDSDFLPFEAGIEAGAPFVLVSHNVVECMDTELPASLSPAVHSILRDELGFTGIAITDDLAMDAVKAYANGEAAVLAVLAGNDMLITSDYQSDIPAVLAAVQDGRISESTIDEHVLRVLQVKQSLGLLSQG